ncbi:relaxase/mobilization nuclease domain-containing protein [Phenylobacterium sp. J426]|uniref:relaxase/mobilization nuclease domain-containing protein n=1 Tax=Phenylobacterium sp. J426 TaxID=2898439 RepID=UPI002151B95B|nr:relaxase/mobilization nuclease domain-containing protein [Phenylobacterium sp. J426]MCR5876653.1 relaxase/mobilization nuclease domain-containing protein [Phenylobacterium sp. J426]
MVTEFRMVRGFEDVWRPPNGPSKTWPETRFRPPKDLRARLARIVRKAPEVMVKVTGRTRDPAHLAAHLTYITRNGELPAEGPGGVEVGDRKAVLDLARDWEFRNVADNRRRANSPFSVSLILSMPSGTEPFKLQDAARAFADQTFGGRFDYMFALHTDTPHPHVHVSVCAAGEEGARLNPKKADLEAWRQLFARELRARGIEAEATPRRARGVTRKAERTSLRKLRERAEAGRGPYGRIHRAGLVDAVRSGTGARSAEPWDASMLARRLRTAALYAAQAKLMFTALEPADRELGSRLIRWLDRMPSAESLRAMRLRELATGVRRHPREVGEAREKDREPR